MLCKVLLLSIIALTSAYGDFRILPTSNDILDFDDALPEYFDFYRIGQDPIKYSRNDYNKKYFMNKNDTSFSYDCKSPRSPPLWPKKFCECGGQKQSPINLDLDYCLSGTETGNLENINSEIKPDNVTIENNGYSVEFTFDYAFQRPLLAGGPLKSVYIFELFHFHWGMESGHGSEHTLEKKRYDLEMHLVHRNARYPNMETAAQFRDGLAIVGFLFKESENAEDRPFLRYLNELTEVDTSVFITGRPSGYKMIDIMGPLNDKFVAYKGSLTTPPCSEAASWFVSKDIKEISHKDMNNFRRLRGRNNRPIAPNYRPIQSIKRQCLVF